jgi:bifunctional non-homologous end joining protein LigD
MRSKRSAVVVSHPEKVLFPADGITKGELAAYYEAIAPVMLPHLRGRPVTMERFPAGIGRPGFIQKDVSKGFPSWLKRVEVPHKAGSVHYPLADDARSLVWLANQNTIAIHVWASRVPRLQRPDVCVFDLDPSKDDPKGLRSAALWFRDALAELGHQSWVKTSGSKGFHIVVPLGPRATYRESGTLAGGVANALVGAHPKHLTQAFSKAERLGRIYVDIGRNGAGATFVAAYSVRPKPGAPVSAPCTWEEIERSKVGPQTFNVKTMAERVQSVGDLWEPLGKKLKPGKT